MENETIAVWRSKAVGGALRTASRAASCSRDTVTGADRRAPAERAVPRAGDAGVASQPARAVAPVTTVAAAFQFSCSTLSIVASQGVRLPVSGLRP